MLTQIERSLLFAMALGVLTSIAAYSNGFFKRKSYTRPPIQLGHLFSIFGIYLGILFVFPLFLQTVFVDKSNSFLTLVQMGLTSLMLAMTFLYAKIEKSGAIACALKNPEGTLPWWKDFGIGFLAWLVAYPWVIVINQICDFFLTKFSNYQSFEQVAVRFLRDNLHSIEQLIPALILILVIAPIIEELLFRGMLQQYLKKHFSVKTSIVLTSTAFSFFHYASEQGLGNFSLIPSLFVFACFLGYIYERQGSLYASIGLHVAFNLAGTLQILYFS